MRTLEQRRAENALKRVNELANNDEDFKRCYRSYVERLGPGIVMNGLGQTLATELAAGGGSPGVKERAHNALYDSVHAWLCRTGDGIFPAAPDLMTALVESDEPAYLRAQAEALAWLEWHKKFCRATFPRGEEE